MSDESDRPSIARPTKAPTFVAKTAVRSVAASVLAVKSLRSRHDLHLMDLARILIDCGCRPKLITHLTGLPDSVVRALHSRESTGEIGMGRTPASIGLLFTTVNRHIDATLFYAFYLQVIAAAELDDNSLIDGPTFTRALLLYFGATNAEQRDLKPAHCFLIAEQHHHGKLALGRCHACRSLFMMTRTDVSINGLVGRGSCPMCRFLQGRMGQNMPLLNSPRSQARASFSRLLDSPRAKAAAAPARDTSEPAPGANVEGAVKKSAVKPPPMASQDPPRKTAKPRPHASSRPSDKTPPGGKPRPPKKSTKPAGD